MKLLKEYGVQLFIAADQLLNALIPPLDGTVSYADETLSARAYRARRDGKILGRVFMPVINLLFFWQGPNHCKNAYIKEFERKTTRMNTERVCPSSSQGRKPLIRLCTMLSISARP
jgi:hypothetical protein